MELTNIVDWEHGSSQWSAVLAAAQSCNVAAGEKSALWPLYAPLVQSAVSRSPIVVGQVGQSLDGRVATVTNNSHYINGYAARVHLHRLRALVDAVIVGAGTVIADDPQLTVRLTEGSSPTRVIIDPNGRVPDHAKCFHGDGPQTIVVQSCNRKRPLEVKTLQVENLNGSIDSAALISSLAELGLKRILIEGGPLTLTQCMSAGCLDRLHVIVAPMIIGSGKSGMQLPEISTLDRALRPATDLYVLPGGDVVFDCDMQIADRPIKL